MIGMLFQYGQRLIMKNHFNFFLNAILNLQGFKEICENHQANYFFCPYTKNGNKNMLLFQRIFYANNFFSKSKLGFAKWTFINVQNEKPEKSFEKANCENTIQTIML